MSPRAIHGSGVWLTLALATGIASGCSTANRSSATSPRNPEPPAEAADTPMRPASAALSLTQRENSTATSTAADPDESQATQSKAQLESTSGDAASGPDCSMYAENTPSGIALIFSARSNTPAQVAAQARALAAELKRDTGGTSGTLTEPSSFGTRQVAELTAQAFVTETAQGARLTIDATDPERVGTLRARVLWNMASFLPDSRDRRGVCPVVPRVAAEQREHESENARAGN